MEGKPAGAGEGGKRAEPREKKLEAEIQRLKESLANRSEPRPGSRFFQGCLAKGKGSTSGEYRDWRRGIYDEIRAGMQLQGKLSVERMCQLAGVSRAGFYRHLVEVEPDEEEMALRDALQRIYL
jgi:hypothetical protein